MNHEQRFLQKINKTDSCWIWTGSRNSKGYGLFQANKQRFVASRFAYQSWIGEIPEGLLVCHKCDNPPCVNPDHLFVDTAHGNSMDMFAKDRQGKSSRPQTHCRRGHEFAVLGVKTQMKKGKVNRTCHECAKIRDKSRLTDPVEREKRRNYQREYQRKLYYKIKDEGL